MPRCASGFLILVLGLGLWVPAGALAAPAGESAATPPVREQVSFVRQIKPLFETSCIQCHGRGKAKGGLSLETREAMLHGGDSGPAAVPGDGAASLIVKLVSGADPDSIMPQKGSRWTPEQVALLRTWIDQGATWEAGVTFAKPPPANLHRRSVTLPPGDASAHPIDRLLQAYAASKQTTVPNPVDDRVFARRAWLDTIGLLPTPAELEAFVADADPHKRATLVRRLLSDPYNYADNWLTFWNDLLRNDYKGTGYIDGGRRQITGWLYSALLANKSYDAFVRELVSPVGDDSEGFTDGIVWRGSVPAAMSVPMQAAQNVSQVFLGVNLKCAGCHDSFVSDWTLSDAYGLAAVYSDQALEMVHCDRPTGQTVEARFLYPEFGNIDPKLSRRERLQRFSELLTSESNGRLSRNIVNRLWARLLGRGIVEPLDDMEKAAWSADLLDWLAEDLATHKFDLKRTIELIMTSRAYQLPAVEAPADAKTPYVFHGPHPRRLSAEQFADAVSSLTGDWASWPTSIEIDYSARGAVGGPQQLPDWYWIDEPVEMGVRRSAWQSAKAKIEAAQKLAAEAQKLFDADNPDALAASEKAKAAAAEAARFSELADKVVRNPEQQARIAGGRERIDDVLIPLTRHDVSFRKHFEVKELPAKAYAVVAASQQTRIWLNGKAAPIILSDKRTALVDFKPLLKQGDNVVAIAVDSHTERPAIQAVDREKRFAVFNHLNERSGVTFAATFISADGKAEPALAMDGSWLAHRAADTGWQKPDFDDKGWRPVTKLPAGVTPCDEGTVLTDAGDKIPGSFGEELAYRLPGLVALTGRNDTHVRAALVSSDPLQLALGRPNREMVTSVRQDSATTIQALELTNGGTLDGRLKENSKKLVDEAAKGPQQWLSSVFSRALCRPPTAVELALAKEALGEKPSSEAVADVLWAVLMQPEFQYIN